MLDLGTVRPGSTIRIPFSTFDKDDSSQITMTNFAAADILVYKDGSTTERASTAGFTATTDFDGKTGKQLITIDLADNTTAGFWAAGSEYLVAIDQVTVDGIVTGGWVARFCIGYQGATLNTTIATLSSQTSFTLTAGPAEDDALNGRQAIIHDVASGVQHSLVEILDYTGSTKTVTLAGGATFTAAATDNISIMGLAPLRPATAGQTLVVANGCADADLERVTGNAVPATSVNGVPKVQLGDVAHGGTASDVTFRKIAVASSGNDNAVTLTGSGEGAGLRVKGGANGPGLELEGGGTSGQGLVATAPSSADAAVEFNGSSNRSGLLVTSANANAINASGGGAGAGLYVQGGLTGSGLKCVGGGTSGHGIEATVTSGNEIDANITGNLTGNVSGSVGSVTGNVGGNVAGSVGSVVGLNPALVDAAISSRASSSEVTAIQNNTRVVRVVPDVVERPDSGTVTYRVELFLYDDVGNMEAPDSAPTITLVNQAGTDRSGRLDSTTMANVSTGRYRAIYTASSGDALEQLVWAFSVVEGGATRLYGNQSLIVDTTAVDFTAADRTKLDALHDTRLTAQRAANLDNLDAAVSTRLPTANITLNGGGVRLADDVTHGGPLADFLLRDLSANGTWNNAGPIVFDSIGNDIRGCKLAAGAITSAAIADGAITDAKFTVPTITGVAGGILSMITQGWRRMFKKTHYDKAGGTLRTYADNGTSVLTTQPVAVSETDEDVGAAV